jgi:hypothetical protein
MFDCTQPRFAGAKPPLHRPEALFECAETHLQIADGSQRDNPRAS